MTPLRTKFLWARLRLPIYKSDLLRLLLDIQWWDHKELEIQFEILGVGFVIQFHPFGNSDFESKK